MLCDRVALEGTPVRIVWHYSGVALPHNRVSCNIETERAIVAKWMYVETDNKTEREIQTITWNESF